MIQRCVNCDEFVYAFTSAGEYLLNGNLVSDEKKLLEMESCDKYSMPFKIILRQVDNYGKENLIGNDARIKQLYLKLQDYIADETANTEREIQQFNERKLAELNYKRESAAKDYALLVNIIKSLTNQQQIVTIDCKNSTNLDSLNIQTTNGSDMTDIADTPPITPDSTPMSVDISPSSTNNLKQQQIPHNNNSSSITNKIKDLSTKHSNMINQQLTQVTKTFDFDEIFDMDGMSNNAPLTPTEGHGLTPTYLTPHKSGQSVKFADQSDDGEYFCLLVSFITNPHLFSLPNLIKIILSSSFLLHNYLTPFSPFLFPNPINPSLHPFSPLPVNLLTFPKPFSHQSTHPPIFFVIIK